MTAQTADQFTLDQDKAAEWVQRAIAVQEGTYDGPPIEDGKELPVITSDWNPHELDEEGTVYCLVRGAVDDKIIAAPDGTDLVFEYMADGDGYEFIVRVGSQIELASGFEEMEHLGDPDARGAEAALAILAEAVSTGNYTLGHLNQHVAACVQAAAAGLMARLRDAGVGDDRWSGGDVVPVVDKWLQDHGVDTSVPEESDVDVA